MALTRVRFWDTRAFHDFLIARASTPFAWGSNDCALFVADGICANTGTDIASEFRGRYHDEAGALATIAAVCGGLSVGDAAAHCAQLHALPELAHPLMAQRGDLVVFHAPSGSLVAGLVHLSGRHIVAVGESGLYRFPISKVARAWRV